MAVQTNASDTAEAQHPYGARQRADVPCPQGRTDKALFPFTQPSGKGLAHRTLRHLGNATRVTGVAGMALLLASWSGGQSRRQVPTSMGANAAPTVDGDGTEAPNTEAATATGPIVATLEMEAPEERNFILRATMPVPPGTVLPTQSRTQFSVLNLNGEVAPTQVEVVSHYADIRQGADVVELIARVTRPQGLQPGNRMRFDVVRNPHVERDLKIMPAVRELLDGNDRLMLQTRDVFGNLYTADLFRDVRRPGGKATVVRKGELVKEFMTHATLLPRTPQSGPEGTMPHLMGVHSFIRFYEGEQYFSVDLHVHNGFSGLDKDDPTDDALMEVFFKSLDLRVPAGWKVLEAFETPFGGPGAVVADHFVYPLVKAQSNGNMHMMPRQSRIQRRLIVTRAGREARAQSEVEERHQAFCIAGETPSGAPRYSWWNPETARYYVQNHRLPSLDHVGLNSIRQDHELRLNEVAAQVASGNAGSYPLTEPMLGWAHPWGVPYGGMTGGDEIWLYDGVETAAAASNAGYRLAQLVARLYTDRHPIALFNKDGEPTRDIDWLRPEGINGPWMPMYFSLRPKLPDNDPFGFGDAPGFQTQAVNQQGKRPGYANRLDSFQPIDFQHYVRFTRNLKTLTWLGNDSLSKLDLRLSAELFRLGFHMYPNSNYNHIQNSGLLARTLFVDAYPSQGMGFGRGESWALDTTMAAYATGTRAFRERYYPWFEIVADLVEDGQSDCTGFIQAWQSTNYLDGNYRLRQSYETAITENMLRGMVETIFREENDDRAERLEQVMLRSAYANTTAPYWNEAAAAPWNFMAVGPFSNDAPLYCGNVPSGAHSPNFDRNQYWSSLAYAYQISGDEHFLYRAAQMGGGGDLLNQMTETGLSNLGNMAALIALIQEDRGLE